MWEKITPEGNKQGFGEALGKSDKLHFAISLVKQGSLEKWEFIEVVKFTT